MSFKVYFEFSTGLANPITVQRGTLDSIKTRVFLTEETLGLEIEQYRDNPRHWKTTRPKEGISDEIYCRIAEVHNHFVHWLYNHFLQCTENPFPGGETITPEQVSEYWYGLVEIEVPVERWTRDYYVARMEEIYETLRGRGESMLMDSEPLTEKQASDVISLFGAWIDRYDCRPEVPVGGDYIACSDDGGYYWCEKCGAVTESHTENCSDDDCPVKKDWGVDDLE